MDAVLFGRYFLEFALLYPGAYLCLAPLRDHLKAPKTTDWIAGGALTALCLRCAALCTIFELPSNVFLLPILIVSFRLLRWRTEGVTVSQTAFLFSVSAVMLAVCSLMAVVLNARAETGNQQETNLVSTALLALDIHTGAIVASLPVIDELPANMPVSVENSAIVYDHGTGTISTIVCNWFGAGSPNLAKPDNDSSIQSYENIYDRNWLMKGNSMIMHGIERVDTIRTDDGWTMKSVWCRTVVSAAEFAAAGGQGTPATWLHTVTFDNLHPQTIAAIRVNGLTGKASDYKLYAKGTDGQYHAFTGSWSLENASGRLRAQKVYEISFTLQDGGDFDLSTDAKEVTAAILLAR